MFTGRDLALLGIATLDAAVVSTVDVRVARAFNDSARQANHPALLHAARTASVLTETILMGGGAIV